MSFLSPQNLAFASRSARGTDYQQKEYLIKAIDSYIEVRIHLADQVIASTAREKIKAGSIVVTFARSSVVEQALMEAWDDIRENDPEASFSVVVVDSRPLNEGTSSLPAFGTDADWQGWASSSHSPTTESPAPTFS